jgi:hypothetical protein
MEREKPGGHSGGGTLSQTAPEHATSAGVHTLPPACGTQVKPDEQSASLLQSVAD